MKFTLQQAATATGKAKSTIQRAIKAGKLSATRNEDGSYSIDASELSRVYVLRNVVAAPVSMTQCATGETSETLQVQLKLLQQQIEILKETTYDLRRRLDESDTERRQLLAALTHQPIAPTTEGLNILQRFFKSRI